MNIDSEPLLIEGDLVAFDHLNLVITVYQEGKMVWADYIRAGDRVNSTFHRNEAGALVQASASVTRKATCDRIV
jgi:hypothetical protein